MAPPSDALVTVIIPTLNRLDLLKNAVTSFRKHHADIPHEIVVVDNGLDGSDFWCQKNGVECLKPHDPLPFGHSNNLAAEGRKAPYLLLLNNDTVTEQPFLGQMLATMKANPRCVAVGPKILRGDGTLSHAGVELNEKGVPHHPLWGQDANSEFVNFDRPVNAVTGACMLIKRRTWEQIHGFDPRYENNYEDVDLCLKIRERRWEIWYSHKAVVKHLENQTRGESCDVKPMLQVFMEKWARTGNLNYLAKNGMLDLEFTQKRINLGSGPITPQGYINIDAVRFPGVNIVRDVRKGLPFDTASINRVYCKDLLHLLSGEECGELLDECARVLKLKGTMFLSIPTGISGDPFQTSFWTKDSVEAVQHRALKRTDRSIKADRIELEFVK